MSSLPQGDGPRLQRRSRGKLDLSAAHGPETQRKCSHFRYFLKAHFSIVSNIEGRVNSPPLHYRYVDLTAGPGLVGGEPGSPLIFAEEIIRQSFSWRARFCEIDPEAGAVLEECLRVQLPQYPGTDPHYLVMIDDHAAAVPEIIRGMADLRGVAHGLIYADPNGGVLPIDTMRALALAPGWHKVDVLAYVSATDYKRFRRVWPEKPHLSQELARVGKEHLYVRQPFGPQHWSLVYLTNWSLHPELKRIGLYKSDSPMGARILARLDSTREELAGQQEMDLS
jgi:hypothetical protein